MKFFLPLLLVLQISCAQMPIDAVIWEANQCVAYYSSEMDMPIHELPIEYLRECWADADKRMDQLEARQNRQDREKVKNIRCDGGLVSLCDDWGRCSCQPHREILRSLGR